MSRGKAFPGRVLVLLAAALLLRSANEKHPRGLANSSDVVGRHYMGHVNSVLMALSKCPNPTVFQKTLGLNDFYFGSPEWPHPMGHISLSASSTPIRCGPVRQRSRPAGRSISWPATRSTSGSPRRTCPMLTTA